MNHSMLQGLEVNCSEGPHVADSMMILILSKTLLAHRVFFSLAGFKSSHHPYPLSPILPFSSSAPLSHTSIPLSCLAGDHGISEAAAHNRTVIRNVTGGTHGVVYVLPPG